tara:strand:+ start:249 stop:791 length:543 start_codon:yes stop_codon:yes gene_type:complete
MSKIICIPKNDINKRFLLGKKGAKEILAICLNPSTANEHKLDPTSKNIEIISKNNGYDGWWIVNLHAVRTSKPANLPVKANESLCIENVNFIREILSSKKYNISRVICCWGNNIKTRQYLLDQANQIIKIVKNLGHPCECLGLTELGNPYHPAPMSVNRFLGGINNVKIKKFNKCSIYNL